ncbi:MAG: hypothetical protein ACRELY_08255 [Polyangiaceae bacterium]
MGCGGGTLVTATELPNEPRHPDGVVLEPAPAVPDAGDFAPARGVVALREPLGESAVRDVVGGYFDAFVHEDAAAMNKLITEDIVELGTQGRNDANALRAAWKARTSALDYHKLEGSTVADLDSMQRYGFDDLGGPGREPRPPEMRAGDQLVKVNVLEARVAGERYFGDSITFLLRRDGARYRIAGIEEKDAP